MKRGIIIGTMLVVAIAGFAFAQMGMMRGGGMMSGMHSFAPVNYNPERFTEAMRISRGGQLYDDWWKTSEGTEKPVGNHPLWKLQTNNTRQGYSTYRCKECHGWDYKGKDGAYGKGSHYTGFTGVFKASGEMDSSGIEKILRGAVNKDHDFSRYLGDRDIADLALYIKKGIIDVDRFIDNKGSPLVSRINAGEYNFKSTCAMMCHGGSGTMINFGDDKNPEFVGTVAGHNPWEFIHKVRNGQPGTKMPSAIINRWTDQEIMDLLGYARTLPLKSGNFFGDRGMMGMMHGGRDTGKTRGFGPISR